MCSDEACGAGYEYIAGDVRVVVRDREGGRTRFPFSAADRNIFLLILLFFYHIKTKTNAYKNSKKLFLRGMEVGCMLSDLKSCEYAWRELI